MDPKDVKVVTAEAPQEVLPIVEKYMVPAKAIKTSFFDPVVWEQMKGMAETFKASGAFPETDNAARIMVKLQAGREMGMTPVESIKSFYFVKGTINVFGAAIIRRLREHGWVVTYKDELDKCTATITKGKERHSDSLTFKEAEESNWTKANGFLKAGWLPGANRKMKLRYGATSSLIKTYVPEVLGSAVDIAEVAMDATPVSEAYATQLPQIENGGQPATAEQISTLCNLDPDFKKEVHKNLDEGKETTISRQEVADRIKASATKKARKS